MAEGKKMAFAATHATEERGWFTTAELPFLLQDVSLGVMG